MRLSQQQRLFAKLITKLMVFVHDDLGYELTLGEFHRTKEQQAIYVREGKSQTMNSKHVKKLAADLFLWVNGELTWDIGKYRLLGNYWKSLHPNAVWGGDWETLRDGVHFELDFSK